MNKEEWREFEVEKPKVRGQYIKVTNFPKANGGYLFGFKEKDFQKIDQHFKYWRYLDGK